MSCTGAPVGAKWALSADTIAITSLNPIPFNVMVSTAGNATGQLPVIPISRIDWRIISLLFAAALFFFVMWTMQRQPPLRAYKAAVCMSLMFLVLIVAAAS